MPLTDHHGAEVPTCLQCLALLHTATMLSLRQASRKEGHIVECRSAGNHPGQLADQLQPGFRAWPLSTS